MKKLSGYALIRRHLRHYPRSLRQTLLKELNQLVTYEPVIGIMGKTGVGKSSLCNALFRSQVCDVNAVEACTRQSQQVKLRFGRHTLTLVDLPGVGESQARDEEYREWIPKLDMVLWVLKADDRAFSIEEHFYQTVFTEYNGELPAITWILNQVDKIEPVEQWHWASAQPSKQQQAHITLKRHAIAKQMYISTDTIIPISVKGRYHLPQLVETIITRLPKQARSPLVPHLQNTYQTTTVISHARSSFGDTVVDIIEQVIDLAPLPQVARQALKSTTHHIAQVARSVWSFFFS
ncbi:TPA: GTPase family protein [Providencia rettgeri]